MKGDWQYRLPCKLAAIVLAVLLWSLTILAAAAFGTVTLWNSAEAACERAVALYEYAYLDDLRLLLRSYDLSDDSYAAEAALQSYVNGENYYATVAVDGKTIFSNYRNEPYRTEITDSSTIYDANDNESTLTVSIYLKTEPVRRDLYAVTLALTAWLFAHRTGGIIFCLFGLILSFSLTVFLCCVTARRAEDPKTPVCCLYSRLPTELSALLIGTAAWLLALTVNEAQDSRFFPYVFLPAVLVAACALLLLLVLDIAARVKTHTFWHNTLIHRIGRLLSRLCSALAHGFAALPLIPKTACALFLLVLLELTGLVLLIDRPQALLWVWALEKLLLIPLTLWFFSGLRRIREGITCIADGKLNTHLPTKGLTGDVKAAADDLNRIDEGLQRAVEDRLKSERLRTELITNVSHDIKTPLTSIISYVDLIKKEEPENEQIRSYIDVLDRQSTRLKKLIEDLIEASKASTGNLTVELSACDLNTMLAQAVGEYAERFDAAGLTPILHLPEETVTISADSRHLWRIFENLMNNICKYALSGTRVYLDLLKNGNQAICIFRNISRSELTVSPDELTERFVRGDSSRNTEGSGLGLSIAASLAALQKGRLDITTDGDLFKAILTFSASADEKG